MRFNKIVLIAIILFTIFTLGAVAAADINETSDAAIGEAYPEVGSNDDEIISSSCDEILADGEKSFDDIQALINGASDDEPIVLSGGHYLGYDDDISRISIGHPITIDGNGSTLDGKNSSGIFSVTASNVIIKNFRFINVETTGAYVGGAIRWSGDSGSVVNCSFENCHSLTYYSVGAGVYWDDCADGSVVNCSFVNCSATNGGAVCWSGDAGSVVNCSFLNCSATKGGAIKWNRGDGSVVNCSFENCTASTGGAVYWSGDAGSVVNCSFDNCSAVYDTYDVYGGAVYWNGDAGSVVGCSFVNCSAISDVEDPDDKYDVYGAAIYWEGVNGSVLNCSFLNCYSNGDDYTIVCINSPDEVDVFVLNSRFESNYSDDPATAISGGIISNFTFNGEVIKSVYLHVVMISDVEECQVADLVELNVTVRNLAESASGVYVTFDIPTSLTILSDTSGGAYEGNVWTIGDLNAGQTVNFTMVCRVIQAGNISASSTVTSYDSGLYVANSASIVYITSVAVTDLQVTSAVNCTDAGVGENIGFTIDVFNNGPCDATDVQVAAVLDPRLVMTANMTTSGHYDVDFGIWHVGDLASGSIASLFITCQAIVGGNVTLTSMVSSNENDSDDSNNNDSVSFTVLDSSNTFEDLQTLIDNAIDTLTLTQDYFGNGSQIIISKSITIDGKNHILDAKGASGIFDVSVSGVVIKNINFRNGNFSESQWGGGAIMWCGENGQLENCSFVNCSALNGGAVYWYCEGGSILNCDFADCHADSGAVYWNGNGGFLLNCDFVNCSAVNGPAICWAGTGGSVSDCSFKDCSATGSSGGAVHWYYSGTGGSISGCSFVNCSAASAGALYWNSADGNISGCSFVNCSAQYGGALHLWADSGSVFNCTFENCSGYESGVVYVWGDSCNVSSCEFVNCCGDHVGAIHWFGSGGSVSNCTLVNCHHANENRAIIYSTYKLNVSDTKFETSYADDICIRTNGIISNCTLNGILMSFFSDLQTLIEDAEGTVTLAQNYTSGGSPVTISKSMTIDGAGHTLDANGLSRAFYITANNVVIKNINFVNAKSDADGGAIYWTGKGGILSGCSFENCSADAGGAVYSSADISNSTFVNCSARVRGALDGGNVFDCIFINCSSSYVDGAICTEGTVSGCNFTNCSSYSHAGAVGDARYILNCNFVNCHSHEWGGAISSDNSTVSNCLFVNCSTQTGGGSAINCGYGYVFDSRFVDCRAEGGGSTFFCQYGTASNCSFENCSYNGFRGGAIGIDQTGNVSDCRFVNCSAREGGAIYIEQVDDANILNCVFINCFAEHAAGAIILSGDNGASIVGCVFINCSARYYGGGAIQIFADNVLISNCSFTFNHACSGGAVDVRADNVIIMNSSFISNTASGQGGAICWSGDGGYCLYCNFINCTSGDEGSAIYWSGKNGRVESSNFTVGGSNGIHAVYARSNLTVLNSTFASEDAGSMDDLVEGANVLKSSFNGAYYGRSSPQIDVRINDVEVGQKAIVNVILPADASGQVRLILFGGDAMISNMTSNLYNGIASCEFSNLTFGIYDIEAYYFGDAGYNETSCASAFIVRPKVSISQDATVGDTVEISIDLMNATGRIKVFVDGGEEASGQFRDVFRTTLITELLSYGNHSVTFEYVGDSFDANVFNCWSRQEGKYLPFEYEMVLSPIEVDIEDEYSSGDDGILLMRFANGTTGSVEVTVVDEVTGEVRKFVVEIVNSIAVIDLSEFKDGNYRITIKYSGDDAHAPFTKASVANVHNNVPGLIVSNDVGVMYSSGKAYSAIVLTKSAKPLGGVVVNFLVNGKAYGSAVTNPQGVASVAVTLAPGTYKITSAVQGISAVNTLKVNHLVSLKKVAVKKSAKKLVLTATLAKVNGKFLKGKKITFKFNGKKYVAKTNGKGVAKVTVKSSVLKKLKVGKKVTYQATYLKDTVKQAVKIKK